MAYKAAIVINGHKICKVCGENKEVATQFPFHSTTGYYKNTCKSCTNKKDRDRREISNGRREDGKFIRQKLCISCNETKDLNIDNFGKVGGNYSRTCRKCDSKNNVRNSNIRKGYLPDDSLKTCSICNVEQPIVNFLFTANGYYVSYCRKCNSNRKKQYRNNLPEEVKEVNREKSLKHKVSNSISYLLRVYKKFDLNKGFDNDLTSEFLEESLRKSCIYCSYESTGLDRIDNDLGHTIENTVPCCKECNIARNRLFSFEEMKEMGQCIKSIKDKRILKLNNG